ncbi:hypothetical protein BASA60_006571 [Batrachochytrium salamandrivorans]|nr:hypothetical protein BASA60_006571 [Batrachochytrium salamandrivorans]
MLDGNVSCCVAIHSGSQDLHSNTQAHPPSILSSKMGVSGLTTYLENYHPNLRIDIPIASTESDHRRPLVVDGDSFIYLAISAFNWTLGSQYIQFQKLLLKWALQLTFGGDGTMPKSVDQAAMEKSKVTFVFGGPLPSYKISVRNKRNQDRVNEMAYIMRSFQDEHLADHPTTQSSRSLRHPMVTPIAIFSLRRAGFNVINSISEADEAIMHLACDTDAIVISNDSDFFMYDVPMYVSLQYIFSQPSSSLTSTSYLTAFRGSNRSLLAKALGINPAHCPFIAVLAGCDVEQDWEVDLLFHQLKLRQASSKWKIIIQYLRPLKHMSAENAIKALSEALTRDNRLRVKVSAALNFIVNHYSSQSVPCDADAGTDGSNSSVIHRLTSLIPSGVYHPSLLEFAQDHVFWSTLFCEGDLELSSSWQISCQLRQLIYAILGDGTELTVIEHIRSGHGMIECPVVSSKLSDPISQLGIVSMAAWKRLFLSMVADTTDLGFDVCAMCIDMSFSQQLLVVALRYAIRKRHGTDTSVGNHELNAWVCACVVAMDDDAAAVAQSTMDSQSINYSVTKRSMRDYAELETILFSLLLLFQAGMLQCDIPFADTKAEDVSVFWKPLYGSLFHRCVELSQKGATPDRILSILLPLDVEPTTDDGLADATGGGCDRQTVGSIVKEILSATMGYGNGDKIDMVIDFAT